MKKLLTVLFVSVAMAAAADDSYLYWMVGENASGYTYDTVKVHAFDSDTFLAIHDSSGLVATGDDGISATTAKSYEDYNGGLFAYLGADPSYSSFVIELWNDGKFVAQSEALDMSTAIANYITHNNSIAALASAWAPTSFAIPEPNSALLMLLGCAALGLRRRRQVKA